MLEKDALANLFSSILSFIVGTELCSFWEYSKPREVGFMLFI